MKEDISPTTLTRRQALSRTVKTTFAATITVPAFIPASPVPAVLPEPVFIPENDYPLFGAELPESLT